MANNIHPANYGFPFYHDKSYIVGGGIGFSKMYNGHVIYTIDTSIISMKM